MYCDGSENENRKIIMAEVGKYWKDGYYRNGHWVSGHWVRSHYRSNPSYCGRSTGHSWSFLPPAPTVEPAPVESAKEPEPITEPVEEQIAVLVPVPVAEPKPVELKPRHRRYVKMLMTASRWLKNGVATILGAIMRNRQDSSSC
jgi:hypothetical protein